MEFQEALRCTSWCLALQIVKVLAMALFLCAKCGLPMASARNVREVLLSYFPRPALSQGWQCSSNKKPRSRRSWSDSAFAARAAASDIEWLSEEEEKTDLVPTGKFATFLSDIVKTSPAWGRNFVPGRTVGRRNESRCCHSCRWFPACAVLTKGTVSQKRGSRC